MAYTLREAARAVGVDRTTLLRAVRSGRISATRDDTTNAWLIEPIELHRVYPAVAQEADPSRTGVRTNGAQAAALVEIRELRAQLVAHEATIADLRTRLDAEAAERRDAHIRLTALLTDGRAHRWRTWRIWPFAR